MDSYRPLNTIPLWAAGDDRESWQESELCHREMLRRLPVAVYTCDAEGRVTFFNRAAAELWGREPKLYRDTWCGAWKIRAKDGSPMELSRCPMARTLLEARAIHGEEMIVQTNGSHSGIVGHSSGAQTIKSFPSLMNISSTAGTGTDLTTKRFRQKDNGTERGR